MLEPNNKKALRKSTNKVSLAILIYTFISFVVVIVDIFYNFINIYLNTLDEFKVDTLIDGYLNSSNQNAISTMVGISIGLVFLIIFFRKDNLKLFKSNNKMEVKSFFLIFFVFMSVKFIFICLSNLTEYILNIFNLTAMEDMESSSASSTTISMFIYSSFFAPIVEEIVYRGFSMRSLESYGKLFSIVFSSILFGVMHGNIHQIPFAFCVGLILGFTAMNYSIIWSIILHIVDNFVFGNLYIFLTANLSKSTQNILSFIVYMGFFIIGITIVFVYRKKIMTYIQQNRSQKRIYLYGINSIFTIIFIVIEVIVALTNFSNSSPT